MPPLDELKQADGTPALDPSAVADRMFLPYVPASAGLDAAGVEERCGRRWGDGRRRLT